MTLPLAVVTWVLIAGGLCIADRIAQLRADRRRAQLIAHRRRANQLREERN